MPDTVIASVCMNRNSFLRNSVREWKGHGVPIVIVDWSSAEPVCEALDGLMDGVTVVEVPGKRHFSLARSKNLSYRVSSFLYPDAEYVLSFDCDVYAVAPPTFLERHPPRSGVFYVAGHVQAALRRGVLPEPVTPGFRAGAQTGSSVRLRARTSRPPSQVNDSTQNRRATTGTFLAPLSLLEEVNMYDERMEGYGVEDWDICRRMHAAGGVPERIMSGSIHHQPHGDRTANYRERNMEVSILENFQIMRGPLKWDRTTEQERHACIINDMHIVL